MHPVVTPSEKERAMVPYTVNGRIIAVTHRPDESTTHLLIAVADTGHRLPHNLVMAPVQATIGVYAETGRTPGYAHDTNARVDALDERANAHIERIEGLEYDIANHTGRIADLERTVSAIPHGHRDEHGNLTEQIVRQAMQIGELQRTVAALTIQVEHLRTNRNPPIAPSIPYGALGPDRLYVESSARPSDISHDTAEPWSTDPNDPDDISPEHEQEQRTGSIGGTTYPRT